MRIHTIAGLLTALLLVIGANSYETGSPVVSSGIGAEPIHEDLSSGSRFAQAGVKQQRQVCGSCVAERRERICKDRGVGSVGPAALACRNEATVEACGYCQKQAFCDAV